MIETKRAFSEQTAVIPFLTGGDPQLANLKEFMEALEAGGADMIQIAVPFSDSTAVSKEVQRANERALAAGCTLDRLFDTLEEAAEGLSVPLEFITYYNPVFNYGKERFLSRCKDCGVGGIVVLDLPYEEQGELTAECEAAGITLLSVTAPVCTARTAKIAAAAKDLVILEALPNGSGETLPEAIVETAAFLRQHTPLPCVADFGIVTEAQARQAAELFDGVILSYGIVALINRHGADSAPYLKEYVKKIKDAVKMS